METQESQLKETQESQLKETQESQSKETQESQSKETQKESQLKETQKESQTMGAQKSQSNEAHKESQNMETQESQLEEAQKEPQSKENIANPNTDIEYITDKLKMIKITEKTQTNGNLTKKTIITKKIQITKKTELSTKKTEFSTKIKIPILIKPNWVETLNVKISPSEEKSNSGQINIEPSIHDISVSLDKFIEYSQFIKQMNKKFHKKQRMPNFPEISENLVKYMLQKATGHTPLWKPGKGDLIHLGKRIEVKCFSSKGPASFGPTESWDTLCFLDATDYANRNFKCYIIHLSNFEFGNIKVNSLETYADQCIVGKRPRISFNDLRKQIPSEKIEIIFDGNLSYLLQ